jgi:hypothetical protein
MEMNMIYVELWAAIATVIAVYKWIECRRLLTIIGGVAALLDNIQSNMQELEEVVERIRCEEEQQT